ncbi:MAG: GyrI-like domain-containing protein, partial [Bacteroidota bacterium]
SLRDTVEAGRMAEVHAQSFARIRAFLKDQSLEAYAAPLTIYHRYAETIDLEVGIPVADSIPVQGSFNLRRMDPGKCITATHVGSYANLGETYTALETWLSKHQRQASGPPWEVYITEPASQPDTTQWYTQVFYPL